jgi:hypothetical protein
MNHMSATAAFSLVLLSIVVKSTPITPLTLKIDLPQFYVQPPSFGVNPIKLISIANIQLFGTECPSTGCLSQLNVHTFNQSTTSVLYTGGAGTATLTMSSFMTYAHDVMDIAGTTALPNTARNASFCLDDSSSTYCSTDFAG